MTKELEPVVATCKIVYGKKQHALPGEIFVPTSAKEARDLVDLKAVRKPNDAELALYEKTLGRKAAAAETAKGKAGKKPKPETPAEPATTEPAGDAGDAESDLGDAADVLG